MGLRRSENIAQPLAAGDSGLRLAVVPVSSTRSARARSLAHNRQMAEKSAMIRDRVLNLFESARKAKGAPYEAERFQAFLTQPPRNLNGTIHRSRFARFMYSVEQEFGFCFTREEWERRFSLDEFVSRI